MVGATGIEPVTPSMSTRCSPAELRALTGSRPYIGSRLNRQGKQNPSLADHGAMEGSGCRARGLPCRETWVRPMVMFFWARIWVLS